MATKWVNNDGLVEYFGTRTTENERPGMVGGVNREKELVLDVDYTQINAGVGPVASDAGVGYIPAGSTITAAEIQVGTAFTSGGAATLDIGTALLAGTAIDADGIDVDIAVAALTAGTTITCNGALIGELSHASADSYITMADVTAAFTAGTARLVVKYVPPVNREDAGIPATV